MKFVQLSGYLKERAAEGVFLIEGEDAYFRDRAAGSLKDVLGITQPSLNDVRYEGEGLKGDRLTEFLGGLYTLPFLDEKRLVRLYEFYPSEKDAARLAEYAQKPCPTTLLLIVNAKKSELRKKKEFTLVDCGKESEEMLARFVIGLAKKQGLSVDGDAAGLFVRYCNYDAARLSIEVKKLALLLGEGGRVTSSVVENEVAKDVEYKIFELTQAASRGNRSAFSEILHDLMEKGFDENAVLASLTSHYRTLAEIAGMAGTDAAVGEALGLNPYAVKKNREVLARLGKGRAQEMYLRLYTLTADMRSGLYTKTGALAAAVAKIFFG